MPGSTSDNVAERMPAGDLPRGAACTGRPGGIGGNPDQDAFDDLEVVDEFGLPILPPDHTEQELAAILATNPYDVEERGGPGAGDMSRGPDGTMGAVVDVSRLLLDDLRRLAPGVALVGALKDLTGLEPPFDAEPSHPSRSPDAARARSEEPGRATVPSAAQAHALALLADDELRSVVAGWERVVSWVRAAQAQVAAELMARTEGPLARDSAAGEISDELHITSGEGWQIAARGEGTRMYPCLDRALARGDVDTRKADTFLRAGSDLTLEERGKAITDLLPAARTRTWRWVSEQMNARAATLHGKARRRGVLDRCNVWAEQAGSGMGRIVADLPVINTARTFNAVQAAARALKDVPGETRPLGALRAAAFSALVTGRLVQPDPEETSRAKGADGEDCGKSRNTGSDDVGSRSENGKVGGTGCAGRRADGRSADGRSADQHDADQHDADARLGDREGSLGGGDESARLVEPVLDTDLIPVPDDSHGISLTAPSPGSETTSAGEADGTDGAGTIGDADTTNDADSSGAGGTPRPARRTAGTRVRVVDVSATVNVTVPATMLLDPADMTPAVLEGIGPIPAEHTAEIARDATWRRLLTDPVTGILTDHSTHAYAPGATLRAAVIARDRTCMFPGCQRPALAGGRAATDLDHIQPFEHDRARQPGLPGQTRAENLHALCRKHHNLKTHAGWRVTRDPDTGVTRWTPPTGTTTSVEPTVVDPTIRYGLAHGMTLAGPSDAPQTRRPTSPAAATSSATGTGTGTDESGPHSERGPGQPPF
ncbi:HNH endonuclease signature motif containing protein [Myceligenerans indicum]|uniref:HNH nuclease domain-containing protein n=1 Tax=Myceligenerans indicum TaxID=2593663 RepID=A0ABS1LN61_9MICO|nr:HNH endonuclease signature motif containing protein [Myceligenerans indicum]MBL0887660.1 hypothetical protein [Myceligenerans indicum]